MTSSNNLFSKTEIKELGKLADYELRSSYLHMWKRATSISTNEKIADIYEKRTNKKLDRNWSCATCTYNVYRQVGELYLRSISFYEAKNR